MTLAIRTNRALTHQEIKSIQDETKLVLVPESKDFQRNSTPSFPLFKSLKPNYVLATEVLYEDYQDDDYEDEEWCEMEELGKKLEGEYVAIVHTCPN